MARQWRIEYPGALYHVLSRGNGCQDIFLSDQDRYLFLELLQELSERFGIHICAYVLMGNHYHLLLRITEANLSKAMQWFGTAYTRRFHITNRTGGHLFQGRFKSIIVENEAYMLRLSCYIHRNPLRAGLVERLADYPWSSYPFYAYKKKTPAWLATDLIMGQISGDNPQAGYRRMVQQYADEKGSIWEDIKHGLAYGSQGFLDQLKERFLRGQKDAELPQQNRLLLDADPQKLAAQAAAAFGLDLTSIRNARRISSHAKDQRDMLIYFLWETGRLSNQRIASLLNLTYSNISRRVSLFKERVSIDEQLNSRYILSKSQIKV
jgi:REP element-mobilizing transposase RayT